MLRLCASVVDVAAASHTLAFVLMYACVCVYADVGTDEYWHFVLMFEGAGGGTNRPLRFETGMCGWSQWSGWSGVE